MNDKITAIVLQEMPYKENDSLVHVLTKEYGQLSLVLKGTKKIDSKNRVFPMNEYNFTIDYKENKTIFTARNKQTLTNYYLEDLMTISFSNIILEACVKSKSLDVNLYDDLLCFLSHKNYLSGTLFFSKLARYYGINPEVDGCVICGSSKIIRLNNQMGGFVCVKHSPLKENQDLGLLKRFRLINKADIKDYDVLKQFDYSLKDFELMLEFFIHNSGINLNSYRFMQSIFN